MNIKANIPVMNCGTTGIDSIEVSTTCISTIDFKIPPTKTVVTIELNRKHLIAFLLRTQPVMAMEVKVDALASGLATT